MINENYNGRLKLQNLETKIKSLHIKWLQNIADTEYKADRKEYIGTKIQNKQDLEAIIEYNIQEKDYPILVTITIKPCIAPGPQYTVDNRQQMNS